MSSFSQCPGECYDSFWEEENNEETVNLDELFDKYYNKKSKIRIDYYYQKDLEKRWKYSDNMEAALKTASTMSESGNYYIISITPEYQ